MSHGVKISESSKSVGKDNSSVQSNYSDETLSYMVSGIAIPYLRGAATSLRRFSDASKKEKNIEHVYECLHEASCLLEDLDTVDRYVIMCGQKHELHEKILNMRNHIRHDMRDNLTHESNEGRKKRAKKLGINEKLLVAISFETDLIKIGSTSLSTNEITIFLLFADRVFAKLFEDGKAKGRIKNS